MFVLLLACINFMNLSTARSEKRAKEVGIRKSIGSAKFQLVSQFFSESLVVAFLAFLVALFLVQLALPAFNQVADKRLVLPWAQPLFWLVGVGFSVLTGVVAGSYPALYLSSFQPVKVLVASLKKTNQMNKILFLLLISLLFSSCGVFLQKTGLKNYTPNEKITQKGLNNYQYDFLYLTKLLEEGYPQLDSVFPKDKRQEQADQILSTLAIVDNNTDFVVQARSYLSNLKNQHTTISLSEEFKLFYPYIIFISSDDWYLLNVSRQYESLQIGKKIIEINGLNTRKVEEQLIDYTFAENKINQQFKVRELQFYNKPQYLKQIGVIKENSEILKLKFEDHSEIELSPISTESKFAFFDISFKGNPITKYQNETYWYTITKEQNFGYLQFNRCHDKIDILEGIKTYVKPWLQPIAIGYVKRQFKKDKPSLVF